MIEEYSDKYETPDKIALHLIDKAASLERNIIAMEIFISQQGVYSEWKQGENSGGIRENPLISKLNQTIEQQRKILAELKLTPASRKITAAIAEQADEFETF
ncbi:MAG: P27 family phage terminase small subunit [Oscillospiraceae bacterium]|nr:P27 family phage terminase small subunit [Oscillospiraceae bacterium]